MLEDGQLRSLGPDGVTGEALQFGWSLNPWLLQVRGKSLPEGSLLLWPDSASAEALRRLRVLSLQGS
ncbi:hypothetical protein [Pseudomaricurvus sp. HS19]|uniref:hypothetical protein n=1 Tax=Pseudomaricurvus sp. HS19 TaxID=2692626 RepID=UPI001367B764|nr:hypothetical protein [Pseudomaricurvus sp. HS19]MYM62596.1 hypothetical protein [Pseudomaricurvus sp. HS19]